MFFLVFFIYTVTTVFCDNTGTEMLQIQSAQLDECPFLIQAETDPIKIVKDLVKIIGQDNEEQQSNSSARFAARQFKSQSIGLLNQSEIDSVKGHVMFSNLIPSREGITKIRLMKDLYKVALKFTSFFERIDDSDHQYIRRSNHELNHTLTYSLKEIKCRATQWLTISGEDVDNVIQELQTTWLQCNSEIQCSKRDIAITDVLLQFYDYIVESAKFLRIIH